MGQVVLFFRAHEKTEAQHFEKKNGRIIQIMMICMIRKSHDHRQANTWSRWSSLHAHHGILTQRRLDVWQKKMLGFILSHRGRPGCCVNFDTAPDVSYLLYVLLAVCCGGGGGGGGGGGCGCCGCGCGCCGCGCGCCCYCCGCCCRCCFEHTHRH